MQSQQTISSGACLFACPRPADERSAWLFVSQWEGEVIEKGSKTIIRGVEVGGGVKKDPEELDEEDGREIKEIVSWRSREIVRH